MVVGFCSLSVSHHYGVISGFGAEPDKRFAGFPGFRLFGIEPLKTSRIIARHAMRELRDIFPQTVAVSKLENKKKGLSREERFGEATTLNPKRV